MTGQNYVDDVMQLAAIEYTALEVDRGTVLMFVNDARNAIFNQTRAIVPWHYGAMKVNAANPYTFVTADRFAEEVGVYVSPAATSASLPATKVSRQELNFKLNNSFDAPTTIDCAYNKSGVTIQLYPTGTTNIDIDYSRAPTDLALATTEDEIPYAYQQLVVRKALISVYEKLNNVAVADIVRADFEAQIASYESTWKEAENQARIALQSKQNFQSMQ